MLDTAVGKAPADALIPGLAHASNPRVMLPLLAAAAGLAEDAHGALGCTVSVLKHWPGKRCTLRYELTDRRRAAAPPLLLVGKVYRRPSLAVHAHQTTSALRTQLFDMDRPYSVPASLAVHPELGLVLQQHAQGSLLSDVASPNGDLRPYSYAGSWLAALHSASPVSGLPVKTLDHEIDRIDEWSAATAAHLPLREQTRLNDARALLGQLAADTDFGAPTMTHRDFYPGNVLWDEQRVCVIDFDWLALGLPALDVGRFLAQIEKLSHRITGRPGSMASAADHFLDAYLGAGVALSSPALRFSLAHTFLNLGADEVRRRKSSSWLHRARLFARRACEEAERTRTGAP